MPNILILNAGVTKMGIRSRLKLLMKMLHETNVLMRKLVQEVGTKELQLGPRKLGKVASMLLLPMVLQKGKLLITRTLEKMHKGRYHNEEFAFEDIR